MLLFLISLFFSCLNKPTKTVQVEKEKPVAEKKRDLENESKLDNEVINQTIQSIVDSLDKRIKINLGEDYFKYKIILIGDSIRDYGEYSVLSNEPGIILDSLNFDKKNKSKLILSNKRLGGGKELETITSANEYSDLVSHDFVNRVLLTFSSLHFNRTFDKGVFTLSFSCSLNAGCNYAAYVEKEDGKWQLKRIIESAIR